MGERQISPLSVSASSHKQEDLRLLWSGKWWSLRRCSDGAPGVRPAAVGAA
jgi:hypothetical protein